LATIFERVRKVTVDQLGVTEEEVTPSSSFVDDLGADSLDLVELIMALEEEFTNPERKVSIPDEDAEKIITVQDAMDYIRDLGVADNEPPKGAEKAAKPAAIAVPAPPRPAPTARPPAPRPTQASRPQQTGGRPGGNRPQGQRPPQRQGQVQGQNQPPRKPQGQNQSPRKTPAAGGPPKPSGGSPT